MNPEKGNIPGYSIESTMPKTERCYAIEPAENGWVVTENVYEYPDESALPTAEPVEKEEESLYDPSAAFAADHSPGEGGEDAAAPDTVMRARPVSTKFFVFSGEQHEKMIQFIRSRTMPR